MQKNTLFLGCSLLFMLVACNQATETNAQVDQPDNADTVSVEMLEEQPANASAPAVYEMTDTNHTVQLLNTTTYHGDEVWEDVDQQTWMGLYIDKPHYFLEETTITAERVNDAIVDEDENSKTGWEISDSHPAESLILISGVELEQGEVIHTHLDTFEILPGDTVEFVLEGKTYQLFASGEYIDWDGYFAVENYKLFLSGEKNGKPVTQLLVAQDNFDDEMINILFAGDIDRDHFPDFLIDNSRHYNMSLPTLYLSSKAAANKFVELVGWQQSVGC